ncbi:MAG: hypothetical protein HQ519_01675 [Planctomycetes bacterium]|nr:hypothetical protein [Planctomycetota bacterium]
MKKSLLRQALAVVVTAGIVAIVAACSVEEHYQTLGIFFDGVPTPEETAAKVEAQRRRDALDSSIPMTSEERANLLSVRVEEIVTSNHDPVEKKLCTKCHVMKENESGWPSDLPELIVPPDELCLRCHDRPVGEYTHGPAAAGGCAICHQSHTSLYPHLLRNKRQEKLCRACHQEEVFLGFEKHKEYAEHDCIECHDPHASDHEYLLKEPTGE